MAASVEQTISYPFQSHVDGSTLHLASSSGSGDAEGLFFKRALLNPRRSAKQLQALMAVVQARHYIPSALLARILREADPIVTANDDVLRFEGFSACCGVHARVDLLPAALSEGPSGRGTTNVDFNPPMLAALANVQRGDAVSVSVGTEGVTLRTDRSEVTEQKVDLPLRWLRGLVEVQSVQQRMDLAFTVASAHAFRFLRSIPRTASRDTIYLQAANASLRQSRVRRPGAVPVAGLERLRCLEPLAADAERLLVFTDATTGASAWVLEFDDSRLTLTLSPGVWRGFSGEGQALTSLADQATGLVPALKAQLRWANTIDADQLAMTLDTTVESVEAALQLLGTHGLVGFDLVAGRYFHRELPFDLSSIEDLQPRLKAARKLIDSDAIRVSRPGPSYECLVDSKDVQHRVTGTGEPVEWACTCPWYAKHATTRGPCKHILAAQLKTSA